MIDASAVQNLMQSWWYDYDQGNFDAWPEYFTSDAHFSCRSDTGKTDYEEFINADVKGKDDVLAWQIDHRKNSPYPLRHNATNVHLSAAAGAGAEFRSYIFVTQIVGGGVSNLSSGVLIGSVREEGGALRIAELRVILDTMDSEVFDLAPRELPA
jgi:hypothetical protein